MRSQPSNSALDLPGLPTLQACHSSTSPVLTPTCSVPQSLARQVSACIMWPGSGWTRRSVGWSSRLGAAVLVVASCASCASLRLEPGNSIVLPESAAAKVLAQCSRDTPAGAVTGTWVPSPANIADLEAHFPSLLRLPAKLGACRECRVESINSYYRQYVGVVIGGRRLVYINAYPAGSVSRPNPIPEVMCDGGRGYWGALYDPGTSTFRDLAFNMEA